MTDETSARTFVERAYALRRKGDLEGSLQCFAPDASFRLAGSEALGPMTTAVTGHAALRPLLARLFADWDWSEHRLRAILVDGERAAVHCAGSLVYIPARRTVTTETFDLLTLRDGRIAEFTEFCDTFMVASMAQA
jgi:ketosteroid isomerase-like protein